MCFKNWFGEGVGCWNGGLQPNPPLAEPVSHMDASWSLCCSVSNPDPCLFPGNAAEEGSSSLASSTPKEGSE